jgi:hypothetical protein
VSFAVLTQRAFSFAAGVVLAAKGGRAAKGKNTDVYRTGFGSAAGERVVSGMVCGMDGKYVFFGRRLKF